MSELGPAAATFDFAGAYEEVDALYQERGFRRRSFEMWERAMEACPDEELRRKIREHLKGYLG